MGRPQPGEHGSPRRWADGCRCQACDAIATYWRDLYAANCNHRVERLKVDLPGGAPHGTRSGCHVYGCGCEPCIDADRLYRSTHHHIDPHIKE